MATIIVTTSADQDRIGLTYRVELPEAQLIDWMSDIELQRQINWTFAMGQAKEANTAFVVTHEDGRVEAHSFKLSIEKVSQLLAQAEYEYPAERTGSGRPDKRVLILTTSKDRRLGSRIAKQTAF